MKNWNKVFSSGIQYRAEIVRAVLEENELNAIIINKKETAYNQLGEYEVFVSADQILKALKIVNEDITFE